MSATPQQIFSAQKASFDKLLAVQNTFFQGFEKLVDLNLKVVKATLDEAAQKSQQAAELKDAQEAVAFASEIMQPNAEKALAYGQHVYGIVSGVQNDIVRLTEEQIAKNQEQLSNAVEQFAKNAPTGSESAVALVKSSLATANNAYESVNKVARQAAEAAESNFTAASNATVQAASNVAETVKTASRTRRTTSA